MLSSNVLSYYSKIKLLSNVLKLLLHFFFFFYRLFSYLRWESKFSAYYAIGLKSEVQLEF